MKILVQGDAKEPYSTTDITLIIALMSLGWRPVAISADNGIVQYTFENEDVKEDVRDLLTNTPKLVTIQAVWVANQVWAMNLNKARSC
jgi:hypothetical protein